MRAKGASPVVRVDRFLQRVGGPIAPYTPEPVRRLATKFPKSTAALVVIGTAGLLGLARLAVGFVRGKPKLLLLLGIGNGQWASAPIAFAWYRMRAAAARDGVVLRPISGWRSIVKQGLLYTAALTRGVAAGKPGTTIPPTAPPGYSNHGAGTAIDIDTGLAFQAELTGKTTKVYEWLKANAHRYGLKQLTGPKAENWHWSTTGT